MALSRNWLEKFDPVMQEVVNKVKASHEAKTRIQAPMMPKAVFEKLIEITGKKVSSSVFEDVRKSCMYVIIAVEVTVFDQSYLSLCLRYVPPIREGGPRRFLSHMNSWRAEQQKSFNVLAEELEV